MKELAQEEFVIGTHQPITSDILWSSLGYQRLFIARLSHRPKQQSGQTLTRFLIYVFVRIRVKRKKLYLIRG